MEIYSPKEDSFFLSEQLKRYFKKLSSKEKSKIKILDLGCGSAIQAKTCVKCKINKKNILCADINSKAVIEAKKLGFKSKKSDLFEKINGKFDIIIFNPPYLPENKFDKEKDTTGGKKGDETILKFLSESKNHLNKKGKIFLIFSSLTPRTMINKKIKSNKFKIELSKEKKIFFETLYFLILTCQ